MNQVQQLKNAINDPQSTIFLVATQELKELINQNQHPIIQKLPVTWKFEFLQGSGIKTDPATIQKWLDKTLDENNKFLINHCEIRVFNTEIKVKKDIFQPNL